MHDSISGLFGQKISFMFGLFYNLKFLALVISVSILTMTYYARKIRRFFFQFSLSVCWKFISKSIIQLGT